MKRIQATKEDYHMIASLNDEQIKNIITPGLTFYYYDKDLYRIVTTFEDPDDKSLNIVIKSWSKYKQRWYYKIENIFNFVFILGLTEQLYKDDNNNFYIKCKK